MPLPDVIRYQLLALRDQVDALLVADALERSAAASTETDPGEPCEHPVDKRLAAPAMGHPGRFVCRACGEHVEEAA